MYIRPAVFLLSGSFIVNNNRRLLRNYFGIDTTQSTSYAIKVSKVTRAICDVAQIRAQG